MVESSAYSKAARRRWRDPRYRRKMFRAMKKKWRNPEYRRKQAKATSEGLKKQWGDPKFRKKMSEAASEQIKKQWRDPKFRRIMSKAAKKKWRDPERRRRMSRASKKRWRDPKFAKKIIEGNLFLGWTGPSKSQISFFRKLKKLGLPNLVLDHPVGRFLLDIADLEKKRAVETDGPHWHDKRRDSGRDRKLKKLGWSILRIPIPFPKGSLERAKEFLWRK